MKPTISIFFPMFNEEENILASVADAHEALARTASEHEVIVVNDASTDRTGAMADELAANDPRVRAVHHPTNRGLGGAIRSGLAASRYDIVVYTDGDRPCDLHYIDAALPLLAGADVVSGYRTTKRESPLRAIYTRIYNALIRTLFGIRVRDVNFAFKLFKHEVVEAMDLKSEGSFIDAEMLAEAVRHGFTIAQVPIVYTPRVAGVSALARPAVIIGIFREMYKYWRRPKRSAKVGSAHGS
jgi:glycosyltransferase involved in cell wall biosynthesis